MANAAGGQTGPKTLAESMDDWLGPGVEKDLVAHLGTEQKYFSMKDCFDKVIPGTIPVWEVKTKEQRLAAAVFVYYSLFNDAKLPISSDTVICGAIVCMASAAEDTCKFFALPTEDQVGNLKTDDDYAEAWACIKDAKPSKVYDEAVKALNEFVSGLTNAPREATTDVMKVASCLGFQAADPAVEFVCDIVGAQQTTAFITYSTQYLRLLYKPYDSVMRGLLANSDKMPVWAGYAGDTEPLAVPPVIGAKWAMLAQKASPSVTTHMVAQFLFNQTAYESMRRWFALRAEWFGLGVLNIYGAMGDANTLWSYLKGLTLDWNKADIQKTYKTYLAYICRSQYMRDVISNETQIRLKVADCRASRFARCFSNQYLGWCSVRANPRLSALCLGFVAFRTGSLFTLDEAYSMDFDAGVIAARKITIESDEYQGAASKEIRDAYREAHSGAGGRGRQGMVPGPFEYRPPRFPGGFGRERPDDAVSEATDAGAGSDDDDNDPFAGAAPE